MKGGAFQDSDEDARVDLFEVEVYPNGAEVWREGGEIRKVVYSTGDTVWFRWDEATGTDRVFKFLTHDGVTEFTHQSVNSPAW